MDLVLRWLLLFHHCLLASSVRTSCASCLEEVGVALLRGASKVRTIDISDRYDVDAEKKLQMIFIVYGEFTGLPFE